MSKPSLVRPSGRTPPFELQDYVLQQGSLPCERENRATAKQRERVERVDGDCRAADAAGRELASFGLEFV